VLVYQRTDSPLLSAITFAISYLPWLLGGPLLSTLADRFPRHRVLIATDAADVRFRDPDNVAAVYLVLVGAGVAGLIGLVRQGAFGQGERVLFVHTGGSPALYAYQDLLRSP